MPYLANLRDICGNVLDPVLCLIASFFLIAGGLWSLLAAARARRGAGTASAVVFGVVLVAAAIPVVFVSEVWISCSLGDGASPSAGAAPIATFRRTAQKLRARFI